MARRTDTPRWTSIEDGAAYLGVHPRTLRRLISDGAIEGFRLGKRAIRVDLNELDEALRPIPTATTH